MRFGVVVPTFNEAAFIRRTIESLGRQVALSGRPYGAERLEMVIADTPGTDETATTARAVAARHQGLTLTVLTVPDASMVEARIAGVDYLLSRPDSAPDAIVSADADTTFPPTWLAGVERLLADGYRMVSTAGCFEHQFWMRCQTLARRYVDHVGTIFFNAETTRTLTTAEDRPLFTQELFRCFGRPVSDCGLAITADLYRQLGGIRCEYYDDAQTRAILAVGWPLMFRAELAGETIALMESPEYETSARRLLHEPEALFSGTSYLQEIEHFRSAADDQYAWLEQFAHCLDMRPLQRYVVKNYILQQCIIRPVRVRSNLEYFGDAAASLLKTISTWRELHPEPGTREIFAFADRLADRYVDVVLDRVRQLAEAGKERQ